VTVESIDWWLGSRELKGKRKEAIITAGDLVLELVRSNFKKSRRLPQSLQSEIYKSTSNRIILCLQHHPKCMYRGADKSLDRPGRKQANVSVRMAWVFFGALPCRIKINLMTARVSMLLKSHPSLTCFRACFFPGRAKDLSAPPGIIELQQNTCTSFAY